MERDAQTVRLLSRCARHLYLLGELDLSSGHLDTGLVRLLRDLHQQGFAGPKKKSLEKLANGITEEGSSDGE